MKSWQLLGLSPSEEARVLATEAFDIRVDLQKLTSWGPSKKDLVERLTLAMRKAQAILRDNDFESLVEDHLVTNWDM